MGDNSQNIFRRASIGLLDGLLLAIASAGLTYLSVPLLARLGTALGEAVEPNKGADIRVIEVVVFLGVIFLGLLALFCAPFVIGCVIFAVIPSRARIVGRIGLALLLLPVFLQTAKRGPTGYFYWLINPSIRENEAKQKAKNDLQRRLKAAGVLTVERESDPPGIRITNNTDQWVRVQVAFLTRSSAEIYHCYPGESATFPPALSDEKMNLPPRETRTFLLSEASSHTDSRRECGFDDFAVWGWNQNSDPIFLSQKAYLF